MPNDKGQGMVDRKGEVEKGALGTAPTSMVDEVGGLEMGRAGELARDGGVRVRIVDLQAKTGVN